MTSMKQGEKGRIKMVDTGKRATERLTNPLYISPKYEHIV